MRVRTEVILNSLPRCLTRGASVQVPERPASAPDGTHLETAADPAHVTRLTSKQKAETLKAETGGRKAKTTGAKKAGRNEQEDGEGNKRPCPRGGAYCVPGAWRAMKSSALRTLMRRRSACVSVRVAESRQSQLW